MTAAMWAILLMWTVLLIYALAASVDFGAGFWAMVFQGRSNGAAVIANRYVSPLWEVTNVFLVLFAVGFVGFFPQAAYTYGNILLVPGSLILILLALRGSFLVFAYTTQKNVSLLRTVSGITGLLLPGLFVSVLPISEGGFVTLSGGHYQMLLGKLFTSPIEYAYLVFGVATELFLSSLLMSDYSQSAGNQQAYQLYQKLAKWLGPITLLSALLVQILMPAESNWMQIR
ncbi:MAG: hypothetical protein JWN30_1014, partial [Bacilli bacterium]|nr:hypothetical protein [Bacilli bacterium]